MKCAAVLASFGNDSLVLGLPIDPNLACLCPIYNHEEAYRASVVADVEDSWNYPPLQIAFAFSLAHDQSAILWPGTLPLRWVGGVDPSERLLDLIQVSGVLHVETAQLKQTIERTYSTVTDLHDKISILGWELNTKIALALSQFRCCQCRSGPVAMAAAAEYFVGWIEFLQLGEFCLDSFD